MLALGCASCSRCDRGQCLQSHVVHHAGYWTMHAATYACGTTCSSRGKGRVSCRTRYCTRWYPYYVHPWDETICDRYECPSGKWLKDAKGNETVCADTAPVEAPRATK